MRKPARQEILITARQTRSVAGARFGTRGFTYIAVLIFIAVMAVGLLAAADVWHVTLKRQKEEVLLFEGDQIRDAISAYSVQATAPGGRFPTSLEDLLKDPRNPATKRYLRKIYPDPMTDDGKWELVKGPNGEVLGVHSTSDEEPAKKANFSLVDQAFEGKTKYSEWVFIIPPQLMSGLLAGQIPGVQPGGAPAPGANSPAPGATGPAPRPWGGPAAGNIR